MRDNAKSVTKEQADEAITTLTNVIDMKIRRAFGPVPFVLIVLPTINDTEQFSVSGNLEPDMSLNFLRTAVQQHDNAKDEGRLSSHSYPRMQ